MTRVDCLAIDGLEIRYQIDGAQDGPWLVFSNSLATNLSIWDHQVAAFGAEYRILRYDQRGHGASGVPEGAVTFDRLARDVLALLDHVGIDRCNYIGLSMGVPTGLGLWAAAPERISRMVLADGQARTAPSGAATWQERIDFARANGMAAFADTVVPRWFSPETVAAGRAEPVREGIAATPLAGFCVMAGALQSFDFSPILETITVPTLLMVGANDGPAPKIIEAMHQAIPDSQFVIIPDAGHIPNWEQPDLFNHAVQAFLAE
jgi:3-oxoadipate enol-lactonase